MLHSGHQKTYYREGEKEYGSCGQSLRVATVQKSDVIPEVCPDCGIITLAVELEPSVMSLGLNNHHILLLPDELIAYILEHTDFKAVVACRRVGLRSPPSRAVHIELSPVMPPSQRHSGYLLRSSIYHRAVLCRDVRWGAERCWAR